MSGEKLVKKLLVLLLFLMPAGCAPAPVSVQSTEETAEPAETENMEKKEEDMKLYLDEEEIPVHWEANASVDALKEEVRNHDITAPLSMYGGNEQFGPLGKSFPSEDVSMLTQNGDIVLYRSDQIVLFYGSNRWAYTKLGHMDLPEEEVTRLLSGGDVSLRLSE